MRKKKRFVAIIRSFSLAYWWRQISPSHLLISGAAAALVAGACAASLRNRSSSDLRELDQFLEKHPELGPVGIVCDGDGAVDPDSVGSRTVRVDWGRRPSPLSGFSHVAISLAAGASSEEPRIAPQSAFALDAELESQLRSQKPVRIFGASLRLYETGAYNSYYEKTHCPPSRSRHAGGTPDVFARLWPLARSRGSKSLSVSESLHILLLHGFGDTGLEFPTSGQQVLRLLTDERLATGAFGGSPLVRTRQGIRYRLSGSIADFGSPLGETHRDQCLCTFADLGVSLDEPVILEHERLRIRDLLAESISTFTFHQGELSWTAQAYAHYLPPGRFWVNQFGTVTTFSDLLTEVMNRGYARQSCCGLHVLQTVAKVVDADYRYGLLHPSVRVRAHDFVKQAVRDLEANQRREGYWDAAWTATGTEPTTTPSSFESRLHVTGHMLELMGLLHPRPKPRAFIAARDWLITELTNLDVATENVSICPFTHAVRALKVCVAYQGAPD